MFDLQEKVTKYENNEKWNKLYNWGGSENKTRKMKKVKKGKKGENQKEDEQKISPMLVD